VRKLSIGSDHRGFAHKQHIIAALSHLAWDDEGAYTVERSDYPVFAQKVCRALRDGRANQGILICGSGIGMAIAANRFPGIYAALCWNVEVARIAKEDDGSNVLVLPSDFVTLDQAVAMVEAWYHAKFKAGRYQGRLSMIDRITEP
jgi:RpiB/LacA/LacB family sugar-phosphate isomerase